MASVILLVKTQSMNSPSSNMSSNAFRFACPSSRHVISIGPTGEHTINHTGDGPYPLLQMLEQRAVSNGSGSSAVSFADVAGVCADLLLSYQRNSVRIIGSGNGGDEGGSRRF